MLSRFVGLLNESRFVSNVQTYFGIETNEHKNDELNGFCYLQASNQNLIVNSKTPNDVTTLKYRINNKFFYFFFSFLTHMGSEVFYILFLPLLTWLHNDKIASLTSISWAINMYLGQITKELFRMPRPSTPPVVKLDKQYIQEYGFPSTHAMAAVSISFTFLALLNIPNERVLLNCAAYFTVLCLCLLISFSRIYMGMHSFLDIFGGLVYSFVVTNMVIPYLNHVDYLLKSSMAYGILFYFMGVCLCLLYPNATRESSARVDTFIIVGVASSVCLSTSLKSALDIPLHDLSLGSFDLSHWHLAIMRIFVGIMLTFLSRVICKKVIFHLALNLFDYKRYFAQNEVPNVKDLVKRKYSFEFFYYFITYSFVSFTVFFTSLFVFYLLSI